MTTSSKGLPLDLSNKVAHFSLDPSTGFLPQATSEQKEGLYSSVEEAQAAFMSVSRWPLKLEASSRKSLMRDSSRHLIAKVRKSRSTADTLAPED